MQLVAAGMTAWAVWLLAVGGQPIVMNRTWIRAGGGLLLGLAFGLLFEVALPIAAVVGLAPAIAIEAVGAWRDRRRHAELATAWPDFLALVRGRLAAGEPLADAVRSSARVTGGRLSALDRGRGVALATTLGELQAEWADPTADRVLTTLRVAMRTGGRHVDEVIGELASSLSEDLRLRKAHESTIAQQQMTAGVALIAPWLIAALSAATNPQAAVEFSTSTGRSVLGVGAIATGVGYVLARRAARLSRPPRVFE